MVNSAPTVVLYYGTPAVASAVVGAAAWWTKPGRAVLRAGRAASSAVRAAARRWIPAALVASISIALGALAYAGHAPDVSAGQAVRGAVIALLASALALSVYWALGRFVRQLAMLIVVWVASLMPLYFYAFFALVFALTYTQCDPGDSGCLFE